VVPSAAKGEAAATAPKPATASVATSSITAVWGACVLGKLAVAAEADADADADADAVTLAVVVAMVAACGGTGVAAGAAIKARRAASDGAVAPA
jgi:hypothetical protein